MTTITRETLEGFLACRLKGYQRLIGQPSKRPEYENLLLERRHEAKRAAILKIQKGLTTGEVATNVRITRSILRQQPLFVLDATLADGSLSVFIDGLKRVDGHSQLGNFHYVPMLFHEEQRVGTSQRLLLNLWAIQLSRVQGLRPSEAIVWAGRPCRMLSVRLKADEPRISRIWNDLKDIEACKSRPTLILNRHCPACEFRKKCESDALQEDSLSLIRNMGEKEIKACFRKGILTLTQLSHTFRPRRRAKRAAPTSKQRYHALQALAIRDNRVYVHGTPAQLPRSPVEIYLDMEGLPSERFVYLIGMIVVDGSSETRHSFWADSKSQEMDLLERFLSTIARHEDFRVFSYGAYEKAFFRRVRPRVQDVLLDKALDRLTNVLSHVYSHFYFPTYSNGLKDIAAYLGSSWTDPEASGIQSIAWRMKWEMGHDEVWKQRLLQYNLEDCAALKRVVEFVRAGSGPESERSDVITSPQTATPVSMAEDIAKAAYEWNFGPVKFVHPDFEHINRCAYFDYQRERVYIRSSPTLKKINARKRQRRIVQSRRLRLSIRVRIEPSNCPRCQSRDISVAPLGKKIKCVRPRRKRVFDLVYTSAGIRRRVIECRTSAYECLACGYAFVPEQHDRLDKHGHGLKSWVMYQHVSHALSLDRISQMCAEFFGLHLRACEVHMLKGLLSQYYRGTVDAIFRGLINGRLLHVDETEIKYRSGRGYVWVLTSMEDVVFMYRPNREGKFLTELLRGFQGVLVSDFYAAYDSLPCPQQKCLVHLIRDMNQDLLANPFEDDLRSITAAFGVLLRAIVSTVDGRGLKAKYLRRHERNVAQFFAWLANRSVRSDAAETLRTRLLKCREKLFTFLRHDGIPWNNNNGEHAIRPFAYYRETADGLVTEGGLGDFLVLLSIAQTCRYRGISFLKFLLSREVDIDAYCKSRGPRAPRPTIEVYPNGFVPSHFRGRDAKRLGRFNQGADDNSNK